jgi:uncharacterized protein with HEPN domain
MPDQSSAASEHAILQEITAPLETLPDDPVAAVHADFPVALRGYDRLAVDAYVQHTSQLVAELQATRSPEAAVRRALERVGEQISGILQRAHETAEEITAQSRRDAEDRLEQARVEAAEIVATAHQHVKDLDADTDRIWIERHRIVDDARELSQQLAALADSATERFPAAEPEPEPEPAPAAEPFDGQLAPEEVPAPYQGAVAEDALEGPVADDEFLGPVAEDELEGPVVEDELEGPVVEDELGEPIAEDELGEPIAEDELGEPIAEDATEPFVGSESPTQVVPPEEVEATKSLEPLDGDEETDQPSPNVSGPAIPPPKRVIGRDDDA